MSRKYEAIDLMKLHTHGSHRGWNDFLKKCLKSQNINELARVRYSIQAGMDDLVKQNLNTEEMILWYIRLNRSLETTAKQIIKLKHPMPGDTPTKNKEFQIGEYALAKRKRDQELQKFMKESSY
jgi:hypothetical protein